MKIDSDCPQILNLLRSDYLDGELEPSVKKQIDQHLELCAGCRSVKEKLAALSVSLRSARKTPPPHLWPRIKTEISLHHAPVVRPKIRFQANILEFFFMRPSLAAAAAAAVLILISVAFYIYPQRPAGLESAPDLSSLAGNIEIHEMNPGFGSNIEQFFL